VLANHLGEPAALGTQKGDADDEREAEGDQAEDDPVLAPGPVEVDHHPERGEEEQQRCGREDPHPNDLRVLGEVDLPLAVQHRQDPERVALNNRRAAD
jgi:hypothetical protein